MLGTIAYFYVNRVLLPDLHTRIEARISEQLRRPVSIGHIRLEPSKGFRLGNVLIKDPGEGQHLVQIDEIDCTVLLAPFFRDRTLVIPNITIRKPIARIVQREDGSFNFSDMLDRDKKPDKSSKTQVFITHIKIVKGAVDFVRRTEDGDFSENFRDIGVDLSLSIDRQIDFRLKTILPFDSTALEANGRYTLGSKNFYAEIKADQFNIIKYQRQFFPLTKMVMDAGELATCDLRVDYLDGKLKVNGDAYVAGADLRFGERRFRGDIRLLSAAVLLDHGALTAQGELRLPAMSLALGPEETFEGDWQMFVESMARKDGGWFLSGNVKARNVNIRWPGDKSLQTHLTARDTNLTYRDGQLNIFGNFDLEDARYMFGADKEFSGQLFAKNLSVRHSDGAWYAKSALRSERTQLSFGEAQLVNSTLTSDQLTFQSDTQAVTVDGSLAASEAVFAFGDKVKFQGRPDMLIRFRRPRQAPEQSEFTGDLTFHNGLIFGLPRVEALSNLAGDLRLSKSGAKTDKLSFTVANTHVDVSGELSGWADLNINAQAHTPSVELSRVTALVPEIFEKYAVNLDGRTALSVDFQGSAKAWKEADLRLDADLIDSRLSGDKLPGEFTGINGNLSYRRDSIAWDGLKAVYKDFPFELTGRLENFSRPVIETALKAADLKADARINLLNKTIRIPAVSAQYHNSDFSGSADIYFLTDQPPEIQINGRGTVYASDIPAFIPQYQATIEPLAPTGVFDTKLFFKGKPGAWLDWSIDVDARSDRVTVKNHPLSDVHITYLQRDKNISKLNLNADVYNGKIKFDSSANLENKNLPFVMALGIYNTDLAQFIAVQNPDKANNLAGLFSLNLGLEGEVLSRPTWTGQGDYKIENGHIWDFKIIKMLNKILLIKEFTHTVYTDSNATFRIADSKIGTEDLKLKSDTISLLAKGTITLDEQIPLMEQKIAFDVYPSLSEITRIQSEDDFLKKFTTVMVSKTLNIIKVRGTLKNPEPKIVATEIPTNILKGTVDTIKGVGESLLETLIGQ